MREKGFWWTFEFLTGAICVLGLVLLLSQPTNPSVDPHMRLACADVAILSSQFSMVEEDVAPFFPSYVIEILPFPPENENNREIIVCPSFRVEESGEITESWVSVRFASLSLFE